MPHELVGKVWSSRCIDPPMAGALSSRYTRRPPSASSIPAAIPAMPPPTTNTALSFNGVFSVDIDHPSPQPSPLRGEGEGLTHPSCPSCPLWFSLHQIQ